MKEDPAPWLSSRPGYFSRRTIKKIVETVALKSETVWVPDVNKNIGIIIDIVTHHFGTTSSDIRSRDGIRVHAIFQVPTMRKWMDGWVSILNGEQRNKKYKLFDPNSKAYISSRIISRQIVSKWFDCTIIMWAYIDDTLPSEGEMTKKELMVIYGDVDISDELWS